MQSQIIALSPSLYSKEAKDLSHITQCALSVQAVMVN